MEFYETWLKKNMHRFDEPACYLGTEPGSEVRDWDKAPLRILVVGASTYENLTGNLAVPMLVRMILESGPDWVCERAFFPNSRHDLELFEKNQIPIFSLESKHRMSDFDIVAFSASFQGTDLNAIKMLLLSGIQPRRSERTSDWPLVIRGGQNDANPTPFMSIYDLMFIGDAERSLLGLLRLVCLLKERGSNKDFILAASTLVQGCLVPKFYTSVYENGHFVKWKVELPAKPRVRAARMKSMDDNYVYKHPIMNFSEEMGSGEILISKACLARCHFCLEGNKERPYRELSADRVVDAVGNSMRESGAKSVTLSAFCVSSYRQKKTVLKRLMEEVAPEVGLTSQRVDESAADPEFMRWSALGGNRSVSFGIEGASARLRKLVNKHASDKDILKAVDNAIKAGYNKIKLFMISNLPTESDKDREELVSLAERVREVRDKYPANKVQIRFNWTDLTICSHTPFQWLAPSMGGRHLRPFLKCIQALGFRVGFGSGKGHDLDTLLQLLHLGDDRLGEVLISIVEKEGLVYFRQVQKNTMELVDKYLTKYGLSRDLYFRQKGKDEPFPWEIVDYGVRRAFLYGQLKAGLKGIELPKCDEKCMRCGVCESPPEYPYEKEDLAPPIIKRHVSCGQALVIKLKVNQEHRYLSPDALERLSRRMFYMNDIGIVPELELASKCIKAKSWVGGIDYVAAKLTTKLKAVPELKSLNKAFEVVGGQLHDVGLAILFKDKIVGHSRVQVGVAKSKLEKVIADFFAVDRIKGVQWSVSKDGYLGVETCNVNARALIHDLWVSFEDSKFWLHIIHDAQLSPVDIYANLTGKRWKEAAAQPAERLDFYHRGGAALEECCGRSMSQTLMGDWKCSRCGRLREEGLH